MSRLDPGRVGADQLVHSSFLGGSFDEEVYGLLVDGDEATLVGYTTSQDFPTTAGAFGPTHSGPLGAAGRDGFIARLDVREWPAPKPYGVGPSQGTLDVVGTVRVGSAFTALADNFPVASPTTALLLVGAGAADLPLGSIQLLLNPFLPVAVLTMDAAPSGFQRIVPVPNEPDPGRARAPSSRPCSAATTFSTRAPRRTGSR